MAFPLVAALFAAGTLLSTVSTLSAGLQRARQEETQIKQLRIQAEDERISARERGVERLRQLNQVYGANLARSGMLRQSGSLAASSAGDMAAALDDIDIDRRAASMRAAAALVRAGSISPGATRAGAALGAAGDVIAGSAKTIEALP